MVTSIKALHRRRIVTYNLVPAVYAGSLIESNLGVLIVHKVNRKNFVCYDEAGNGWNVPRSNQEPLPSSTVFNRAAYDKLMNDKHEAVMDAFKTLVLGSLVEFTAATDKAKFPGVYVVIGTPSANGRIRIARLGGDNGRYVTAAVSMLREADLP